MDPSQIQVFNNLFLIGIDLKRDFERTKKTILEFRAPLVFSHNDLLIYNILYDEKSGSSILI